ncbi:phosphonomutase [Rathayibacter sp. Leaf299]|uniref:isocitrate lyase/PEP mutase family protein n=1 Tax=Rathayibacter sp. Leaf299 TaxID=1736328 RepID=UPI0006FF4D97|nr:isocitrate lyase/phosphoenolpyruvate mutase family protein [Rathayibacter sp. Leaf299]KQQ20765.1 phosphonomutase [Rathayibacter sp. Leaf299]
MTTAVESRGRELIALHRAPEILSVVNVWDVISATTVAALPETRALATASHSIAATFGYEDGERIPLDLHLDMIGRICAAVDLPVSADLEAGYGAAGETVRKAIGVGVVGANLEDQAKPLADSLRAVEAAVRAAEAEGVPFALNARTDVIAHAGDDLGDEVVADAIERGRAYLEAGATSVFVAGRLSDDTVVRLVQGLGRQRISVIGLIGTQSATRFEELGVARISYGPWTQRVALTALQDTAAVLYRGGVLPEGTRRLT